MPEVLTNPNQELPKYPIKRGAQRKGMGNLRPVKARLGAAGEAVVVDLSEGGIGLELAMPLQPGSTLAVDFDLPESGGHVRVDGRVIWSSQGRRAGIRFERVPDLTSERLKRWVSLGKQASKPVQSGAEPGGPAPAVTVGENPSVVTGDEAQALDRAVVQVLARAVAITKASGAAIAIGPPEAMVCRASAGNAPDVGVPINPSSGLTGYCVRNRATVSCNDTETDERVNAAACREMDLRSALLVPVFSGKDSGDLNGILEVFSSQPNAFTPDHIAKLEKLTRILGVVAADLVPGTDVSEAVSAVPAAETSVEPGGEKPLATLPIADIKQERAHLPRKIGERTLSSAASGPAISNARPARAAEPGNSIQQKSDPVAQVKPALAAPVITSQIVAKETAVKLAELTKPATAGSTIAEPIASRDGLVASENANAILSVPSFATTDEPFTERIQRFLAAGGNHRTRIGRALRVIGAIVIALEIAAAVFLYTRWQKKKAALSETARAVQTVPAAAPVTPPAVPTAEVSVLQAPTPTPVFKRKAPMQNLTPDDGSDEVIVVNRSAEAGTTGATPPGVAASAVKDIDPPVAPMEGKTDLAAIHLPENPVKPSLALRTSSGTFGGKLIKRVEPVYPDAAKTRGIRGQVLLNAHIGTDGTVKQVRVLKGNPFLGNAAIEAVKHWRYEPMKLNGYPVEMDTTVMVEFKLPN